MSRPFTDVTIAKSDQPIKNGTIVGLTSPAGTNLKYNFYVKNTPTIMDIQSKYGNNFYNGIFVQLAGNQTIIGA